jgi:DNA-binding CsgD family transcriptional regulator
MTHKGRIAITPQLQEHLRSFAVEYRITSAEFRVLCGLVEGLPASGVALRDNITYETVRSQIKSIFSKTDTHRQAELLALILHHATRVN